MSSNADIQHYKNILVEYADQSNDVKLKVGCNGPTDKGIVLDYDLGSVVKSFKINSGGLNWTDGINTFNTSLDKLCALEIKLPALQIPPYSTTMKLNDTLLLNNGSADTLTLDPLSISSLTTLTLNAPIGILLNSAGGTTDIGDVNNTLGKDCIIQVNPTTDTIRLDGYSINSYGYAMPICFTRERADTFSYNFNGTGIPQTIEQVYLTSFAIPNYFTTESPSPTYTSTIWKVDFALNCWNCSTTGDKGLALFFTLQDATTTYNMSPQTYNANTPYAVYNQSSTYTSGSGNNNFQNFNWSDFIDLAVLQGQGSGALPLNLLLNFGADNPFNCKFQMTVTLTRTNLV
jgi:hypothetical protein